MGCDDYYNTITGLPFLHVHYVRLKFSFDGFFFSFLKLSVKNITKL